ncbi:NAD(P)-dependent oxidoreductase [Aquimarina sp. 2201CG5-10]|uniref:NAD(P)-dependent oxidoreductase n=1 Tax=Aquimarina callyspongiae TaxID=3098150 RepID=UPI002AB34F47|nr:NAD(P)-dependent oxidoreductase [Aquimarina sp. 2201CG5-10]MDY8134872.1 NAD(P)-dependent oxidoreductase [Aquimarina sp. 2201CG5-10]
MKKLGFIGLGIMGSRMAANLQKEGYKLIVTNRTKKKADDLIKNGAIWVNSAEEVAEKSDIVITMLSTPEVVKEVATGKKGLFNGLSKNSIWINCSTVNPSFSREIERMSKEYEIRYLDAPVMGTTIPAEKGELVFLVGGDQNTVKEIAPLLDSMGKKTLHLGEVGNGAAMKMLVNQLLGQSLVAFSEALIIGEAMGLEKKNLFDVLLNTPGVAPLISSIRSRLENANYDTHFPLKLMLKDLHLSSISAYENGIASPSLNITKEIFAQARQYGLGELDFTAVYKYLHLKN